MIHHGPTAYRRDVLEQPMFALAEPAARQLIQANPWATLVSTPAEPGADLVVSHLPVLQDPAAPAPVLLGHLAAADAELHDLGRRRVVVVVEGASGYISPTWYRAGPYVPTWNFEVVHLHGVPQVLDAEATYDILDETCAHMEAVRSPRWQLDSVRAYAEHIAPYTTGFRLVPERVVAKSKMSQDKPVEIVDRVIHALRTDPYQADPRLADAMAAARQAVTPAAWPS